MNDAPTSPLIELGTVDAVLDALGGVTAVAELTGDFYSSSRREGARKHEAYPTVHYWKQTGAFPPKTYVLLITALAEKGYTAPPSLWKMIPAEATPS
jgi:hypothetical protein